MLFPSIRYDSLRILLSLAVQEDYENTSFDVQTAFLYGELKEKVNTDWRDLRVCSAVDLQPVHLRKCTVMQRRLITHFSPWSAI